MKENITNYADESYGGLMVTTTQQMRLRLNKKFKDAGLDVTSEQCGCISYSLYLKNEVICPSSLLHGI